MTRVRGERAVAAIAALAVLIAAPAWTQDQRGSPAFEVASVRPNPAPQLLRFSIIPGGQLVVTGYKLVDIIRQAFDIPRERLIGVPEWAMTTAFDITAKAADAGITRGSRETMQMLQTLLRSRFGLKAHSEQREMPIYVLRIARPGRLGPQLRPSTTDCGAFVPGRSEVPEKNAGPRCAMTAAETKVAGIQRISVQGRSLPGLAFVLELLARRPVKDETGLSGLFDADIDFTLYSQPNVPEVMTLFTAAEEQLGLKLEPSRGPVEVLVIDSLERPTPN